MCARPCKFMFQPQDEVLVLMQWYLLPQAPEGLESAGDSWKLKLKFRKLFGS